MRETLLKIEGICGVDITLPPVPYQPNSPQTKNACRGPLMVIYKKKLCYATSRGRMAFKTKYPNCRHNFGTTRPVARFQGFGGKIKRLFRDVVMKCKCKKIAGNQNQSYRSVIKTYHWRSKHEAGQSMCAAMNVFFY